MYIEQESILNGLVELHENEYLFASRVATPDQAKYPLHDNFGPPLLLGVAKLDANEIAKTALLRAEQLERAESVLQGSTLQFSSPRQKFMQRAIEVMLFYTDGDILNPGYTSVLMRIPGIWQWHNPMDELRKFEAFPIEPNGEWLNPHLLYRPRPWGKKLPLPWYVTNPHGHLVVQEVTGFQRGHEDYPPTGLQDLIYPILQPGHVSVSQANVTLAN